MLKSNHIFLIVDIDKLNFHLNLLLLTVDTRVAELIIFVLGKFRSFRCEFNDASSDALCLEMVGRQIYE